MFEAVKMLGEGNSPEFILAEIKGKLPPYYSAAKTAIEKTLRTQFA